MAVTDPASEAAWRGLSTVHESKGVILEICRLIPPRSCRCTLNGLAWASCPGMDMQSFEIVRHREDLWSVMSNGQIMYSFSTPEEADDAALMLERLSGTCCRFLNDEPCPRGAFRPRYCTCLSLTWWELHKRC